MEVFESIILGAVQGLTEFLPVSSSGHLQLAKELLGVELEENLAFDVVLHAATVLSTIVVLWREIVGVLRGLFTRGMNEEKAYIVKLIISMIPIGIVGFTLKDQIDAVLASNYIMVVVGAMLLVTATLLAFAYYAKPRQKESLSYRDAFIIGVSPAVPQRQVFRARALRLLRACFWVTARRLWRPSRSLWSWRLSWVRRCCISSMMASPLRASPPCRSLRVLSQPSLWVASRVAL